MSIVVPCPIEDMTQVLYSSKNKVVESDVENLKIYAKSITQTNKLRGRARFDIGKGAYREIKKHRWVAEVYSCVHPALMELQYKMAHEATNQAIKDNGGADTRNGAGFWGEVLRGVSVVFNVFLGSYLVPAYCKKKYPHILSLVNRGLVPLKVNERYKLWSPSKNEYVYTLEGYPYTPREL